MSKPTARQGGRGPVELSHPQLRAWYSERLHPGTGVGNLAGCVHFPGRASEIDLLGDALGDVVAAHEALRTRLCPGPSGTPRQYVVPPRPEPLEVLRLGEDRGALRQESTRPFELLESPLHAFRLLELPEGRIGFFFKYHHAVVDALTVSILNQRIHAAFLQLRDGIQAPVVEGGVPFSRFLERERRYLGAEAFREDLRFWLEEYAGYAPEAGDGRSASSIRTERFEHGFSQELTGRIGRFCEEHATTVFRLFLSLFALLLSRKTGERHPVIATGHHNRIEPGDMTMAGMTVSTVPVRIQVDEDLAFADHLRASHRRISRCLAHQQFPFDLLAEELRGKGHDPQRLLRVFVNHVPSVEGDYEVERYSPGADVASLDVKINPNQRPRTAPLELGVDAQVELYDRAAVLALFERVETLVEAAVASPDRPLRELEHVPPRQRAAALAAGRVSLGPRQAAADPLLLELLAAAAARSPEAPAVADVDGALTYGALAEEVQRLARRLVGLGVAPADRVAVLAGRRVGFVAAALSAMRAGAAYVPITPETPTSRVLALLAHAKARVVLTDEAQRLTGFDGVVVPIAGDGPAPEVSLPLVRPSDVAYVIYTSGTSGKPKGVMVDHRALARFLQWNQRLCGYGEGEVASAFCSFMFDVSVGELFTPLCSGALVEILPEEVRGSVSEVGRYLIRRGVTVATLPTRVGELFLDGVSETSIRLLVLIGEKLLGYRRRGYEVLNAYGPTEATIYVTAHRVVREEPNIPIGVPAEGSAAYVVDGSLRPVAPGEVGELLLAGPQLARGYLDDPATTAEVFVQNPFATGASDAVAYRTGDLARLRPDGALELHGRADRQVKVRGFRVEPDEIERALAAHPAVRQCVVVAETAATRSSLHAFYVTEEGLDGRALRVHAEERLQAHLVPESFVSVPRIPLTARGKTDVASLLLSLRDRSSGSEAVPPRTGPERVLLRLFGRALGRTDLGVTSDFFESGGDSIRAMTLFADIEAELGQRLPVSVIFQTRTVEGLACLIEDRDAPPPGQVVTIRDGRRPECLFCIHDLTGDVMPYRNLAAHLETDLSIRGIRFEDDPAASADTVEELAARYVRLVRGAQPRGPYRLLGYSIGGTIAYEMARQLRRDGREVALLGLVDTPNYAVDASPLEALRSVAIRHTLSWLRSMSFAYKTAFVASSLRRSLESGRLLSGLAMAPQRQMKTMLLRYVPGRYDGEVLLFRARERLFRLDDRLGWGCIAPALEVVEVPGNHISILADAGARTLASRLEGSL